MLTRQVRLEEKSEGDDVAKTFDVDATGALTELIITHFGGKHYQHL